MSLYRQYRPKTFADVAGQSPIVDTLNQAVLQDKLAHAYLFAGIRGTGKTSIARILAKELLTRGVEDEVLTRNILQAIEEGNLVDLIEIDAASNRGIDDIRSLLEKIQFTPVVAKAKVYIIDEVHMLTKEAFNALLKTLEEPPAYAFFILATTELHKIPATIQSRCQRFLFRQIREEDVVGRLRFIADAESISIDDKALKAIAHHSGGSMRDAISLLDQLRSLTKDITMQDVKERIGESGHEYVEQLLTAIQTGDTGTIVTIVRSMEESAVPFENVTRLLLEEVRKQLHTAVQDKKNTAPFVRVLDAFMDTIRDLRIAPVPGLVLESTLLSLTQPQTVAPVEMAKPVISQPAAPVIQKVPAPVVTPAAPVTESKPIASPVADPEIPNNQLPITDNPTAPAAVDLMSLKNAWPDIVAKTEPAYVRMSLKNGHLHAVEGNNIIVVFGSSFHRDKASSPEGARSIDTVMESIFKVPLRIKCVLESDVRSSGVVPHAEAVNLAEAAADIF
ncbi:DNA polymerase III subunit gamma/tau [Candidatus Peribacteria bacterium]|nr:MAG: DNA polymerase III subunit gamma/tau [Candidatus Peribacteria bacterium]